MNEIELVIPMSPMEVQKKVYHIHTPIAKRYRPFEGSISREYWQITEERNKQTAIL